MRSVLVTGGTGYLGCVLTNYLCLHGYRVIVVDNYLTSSPVTRDEKYPELCYIQSDVYDCNDFRSILKTVNSVIHLAAIVGDTACNIDPALTWRTNYLSTIRLLEACHQTNVETFVFASTCSNYGIHTKDEASERTPLAPQSIYAETKTQAELYLLSQKHLSTAIYILRLATLYGLSPRMRFDLAANIMTARATLTKEIKIYGGEQWRPFLHIYDAARAFAYILETPIDDSYPVYNCGSNSENYRLRDIGMLILQQVPSTRILYLPHNGDKRSYRVNFSKIEQDINFICQYRILDGIREIKSAIDTGMYLDFMNTHYHNDLTIQKRKVTTQVS